MCCSTHEQFCFFFLDGVAEPLAPVPATLRVPVKSYKLLPCWIQRGSASHHRTLRAEVLLTLWNHGQRVMDKFRGAPFSNTGQNDPAGNSVPCFNWVLWKHSGKVFVSLRLPRPKISLLHLQSNTPQSLGLTALTSYVLTCLGFVFFAMLVFALLLLKARIRGAQSSSVTVNPKHCGKAEKRPDGLPDTSCDRYVDAIALLIFSCTFCLYNIFYITSYM